MQVGLLRRVHAGMPQSLGNACDGYASEQQERRVRMAQTMNSDCRNVALFADGSKAVVNSCVEDAFPLRDKKRLAGITTVAKTLEMHTKRPVHTHFTVRGTVLCRGKASFRIFVVPGLLNIDLLRLEIDVTGGQSQRLSETQSGFSDQKQQIVIKMVIVKLQCRKHCAQLELIEILGTFFARLLAFDDCFAGWIPTQDPLVDSIHDGSLHLMVEIHGRLPFMLLGEVVENTLIFHTT